MFGCVLKFNTKKPQEKTLPTPSQENIFYTIIRDADTPTSEFENIFVKLVVLIKI